jgi:hypothetical protein
MAELPPRLIKGDTVRVTRVFSAGDVTGIIHDDDQVTAGRGELLPVKREVWLDGEEAWPLIGFAEGAEVSLGGLVVLVNESDLFLIEEGDA